MADCGIKFNAKSNRTVSKLLLFTTEVYVGYFTVWSVLPVFSVWRVLTV